jgi:hypothetical protein
MSREAYIRQALVVGFVVLALGVGAASAAAGGAAGPAGCGVVTSLKYTYAGRTTTKYAVTAYGVSCSFAKTWVTRLVPKIPAKKPDSTHPFPGAIPAPQGWLCYASDPLGRGANVVPKRAYSGACGATSPTPPKKIVWEPLFPR